MAHTAPWVYTQAMACQIEIFMVLFGALLIKADVSASDGYNEELFGYLILIIVYIPIISALLFQIVDAAEPLVSVSPSTSMMFDFLFFHILSVKYINHGCII